MISRAEILERASRAYADGSIEIAKLWMALLGSLDLERIRSKQRADPDQQDHDEWVEEMSIGGRPYTK